MVVNSTDLLEAKPIKGMFHRKIKEHGVSHGLGEAGYDIRIKQDVTFKRGFSELVTLVDGERFPGWFVIASAIEEFQMPTNLMGIVHDKSTWARQGLSVFNTVIEPGWNGFLTLELVYHGHQDLVIPAGSGIAQVIFHELALETQYRGRYQNQGDKPIPAKRAE